MEPPPGIARIRKRARQTVRRRVGRRGCVSCGYGHTVALTMLGTLVSWGDDSHGQISGKPVPGPGEKQPSVSLKPSILIPSTGKSMYNIASNDKSNDSDIAYLT